MTIMTTNLYKALLAMDSYNRGYNRGINELQDTQGEKLGNATISRTLGDANAQSQGFYAIAYDWNNEKVIAYRGTDNVGVFDVFAGSDLWNGYGVGLGFTAGDQAILAFDFYNAVAGNISDPRLANISLTGHSLGGGLAGMAV